MSDLAKLNRDSRAARAGVRLVRRILSRNRITSEAIMAAIDVLNATNALLEAQPALIDGAIAFAESTDSPEIVTAANLAQTNAQAVTDKLKALQAPVVEPETKSVAAVDENGNPIPEGQSA